ncbi:hypothetical protein GCM10022240_12950 [Microbacterium kribbense]|uniref:Aminoglycoside phosphotransferase domain-containing protein n=1 Tax=Microbacterium kribbense TaxID=433645 RepID=A0ABP7GIX2_9MICO
MARSPLTLAATVTSALPQASVVGVAALTEHAAGRYDTAVADLADGSRVVVRVATDPDAAAELVAETHALRALTSGVRSLLPFRAPVLHGQTVLDGMPAVVVSHLEGYRVDAAHVPAGPGAATSLGTAIAAVHSLPVSVARTQPLPISTPEQVRSQRSRLLDRVAGSDRVPVSLLARWSRALAEDRLWRFEPTLTLGGVGADAFLFHDIGDEPRVSALLDWHGLRVADPAEDLRWLSAAPAAADDVVDAYLAASVRTPDAALLTRARLYAELEFAKWLVHGHDEGRDDIVDDAVALLTTLADTVLGDDLLTEDGVDVEDAIALLGRVPAPQGGATSMETDAFGADDTAFFTDSVAEPTEPGEPGPDQTGPVGAGPDDDPDATAPITASDWVGRGGDADAVADADRASEAALRRWATPQ